MICAALLGIILCLVGLYNSQQQLKECEVYVNFSIPMAFKLSAEMETSGRISGQSNDSHSGTIRGNVIGDIGTISGQIITDGSSQFTGKTASNGQITGFISSDSSLTRNVSVSFPKANRPWLCMAFVFWFFTPLAYLRRLYLIIRRKTQGIESTGLIAKTMAMGGLMYCAGEDRGDGAFLFGLVVIAYAGIGYLAYTRWERVRAQLYKD